MKIPRLVISLLAIILIIFVGFAAHFNAFSRRFISPNNIKANNDLAAAYEKAGRHDEASAVYQRMLKADPSHPDVYVNLAAIEIIKGNAGAAIGLCKKAISLEPANATAHNNLAVAYYVEGEHDLAIQHCDLAIKYGYKVKPELLRLLAPYRGE